MDEKKAETIKLMIEKECCRTSLTELCEYWGVTTEDFWEFLDLAVNATKAKQFKETDHERQ